MATHNIDIPDEFVTAMQEAEVPLDSLEVDWTALEGAVCENIRRAADEIAGFTECAERIAALTRRINALVAVRERMEAR